MRGPFSRFPAIAHTRVARAANPIAFGKRPVEYVPSRPSASCGNGGTQLAPLDAPESRPYVLLAGPAGHSARVCRARGCGGRGGLGAIRPGPDPNGLLYAALDDTTPAPANVPRPASGRRAGVDEDATWLILP
ncbi:hornerin-like [Iris pallida]|uniref:Hornerin-like n=1 Tax=Iris pallida TaxID=29817 RepID=A0AAX6GJA3_IRIPA|nr:hornerin-like [Iris pallida]